MYKGGEQVCRGVRAGVQGESEIALCLSLLCKSPQVSDSPPALVSPVCSLVQAEQVAADNCIPLWSRAQGSRVGISP